MQEHLDKWNKNPAGAYRAGAADPEAGHGGLGGGMAAALARAAADDSLRVREQEAVEQTRLDDASNQRTAVGCMPPRGTQPAGVQRKVFDGGAAMWIATFSTFGVMARHGLKVLSESASSSYSEGLLSAFGTGYLLPNIAGCLLMGYAQSFQTRRQGVFDACELYRLVFAGFTTGLCGCLTTFAAWNQEASMNIARGDVWDGVLMLVMMQVLSVACLRFGRNLERALCGCATGSLPSGAWSSALPQRVVCCCSDMAGLAVVNLLLALVWVGFLFADSGYGTTDGPPAPLSMGQGDFYWAVLMAPIGALLRYALSLYNAGRSQFPMGTFSANVIGSFVSACLLLGATRAGVLSGGGALARAAAMGLCGSLSTVSTYAKEVDALSADDATLALSYRYCFWSLGVAQLLILPINLWSVHG